MRWSVIWITQSTRSFAQKVGTVGPNTGRVCTSSSLSQRADELTTAHPSTGNTSMAEQLKHLLNKTVVREVAKRFSHASRDFDEARSSPPSSNQFWRRSNSNPVHCTCALRSRRRSRQTSNAQPSWCSKRWRAQKACAAGRCGAWVNWSPDEAQDAGAWPRGAPRADPAIHGRVGHSPVHHRAPEADLRDAQALVSRRQRARAAPRE